jgi:hypothetical protein
MRDVLDCPLVLLRAMPLATSLELRLAPDAGFARRIVWTTSGRAADAARAAGAAVWAPDEYEAVALGVERGRVLLADVVRWCQRKIDPRAARVLVDARAVMGGAAGLVPYIERYEEVRVGRGRPTTMLAGKVPLEHVQQRTTLTLGAVLARLGAELVGVEVHARAVKATAAATANGPAWAAI